MKKQDAHRKRDRADPPSRESRDRERPRNLPEKHGRIDRPPVDPDLEHLISSGFVEVPDSDRQSDGKPPRWNKPRHNMGRDRSPGDSRTGQGDVVSPYPSWRSLGDRMSSKPRSPSPDSSGSGGDQSAGPKTKQGVQNQTTSIVRVPVSDPVFPGAFPDRNGDSDTQNLIRVLKRRTWPMLIVAFLIWGAIASWLWLTPPSYEASLTMLVDTRGIRSEVEDLPRVTGGPTAVGTPKIANQALILQSSHELATLVSEELHMRREQNTGPSKWTVFDELTSTSSAGMTLPKLLREKYIDIIPQPSDEDEPDAIRIAVKSTVPEEAALIANAYGETYIEQLEQMTDRHFREALDYYRERHHEQEQAVIAVNNELEAFARTDGEVNIEEESKHIRSQLSKLQSELDDTRIQLQQEQANLTALEEELESMGGQLVAERAAHGIEDQLDAAYNRMGELNVEIDRYYTRNPELKNDPSSSTDLVLALSERDHLQTTVDSLSKRYSDSIVEVGGVDLRSYDGAMSYMAKLRRDLRTARSNVNSLEARESAILNRLLQYEERKQVLPARSVKLAELTKRRDHENELLMAIESRLLEVEDAASSRRSFARVVSPALPPSEPTRDRTLLGVLGVLLGMLGAVGIAFGIEQVDRRLYDDQSIRGDDYDVVGTLPEIRDVSRKKTTVFSDRYVSTDVISLLRPQSPATRALRSIPMRLAGSGKKIHLVTVTGVHRGCGASFLAANMAAVIAQSGMRVLLLDADLYHPSVTGMLGLSDRSSFDIRSASFRKQAGFEVFSSMLPNLFVMSVTGPDDGTADYLLSTHLGTVIARLQPNFDVIVIDTPPVDESTASLGLGRMGDESIVVARMGKTRADHLRRVMDDFNRATDRDARLVLNCHADV